jgi:hypothetical protein
MMGVPSGVIGRRPVQNSALAHVAALREQVVTTNSSVARRPSSQVQVKAGQLAVPPTRMRSPRRVTATLWVSSMMVDSARLGGVGDGHRDRIALDRVDRNADAQRASMLGE